MATTKLQPYNLETSVLGYAEDTSSRVFTTEAAITNISAAVVVPTGGRRVRVTFGCTTLHANAGAQGYFRIKEDGSTKSTRYQNHPLAATSYTFLQQYIYTPTAGAHTYTVTAQSSSGNLTVAGAAGEETFILVEVI